MAEVKSFEVKNMFYFQFINSIGGVETFFYNLAKKYRNNDILILYNSGDKDQINRLRNYVRVEEYKGQYVICEKAFFNYSVSIIDNVKANEYIQIIHADYESQGLQPNLHPKITRYLCVSEHAKEAFERVSGVTAEVAYNPFSYEKPKKVLKLISATRFTHEKGKNRIIKLKNILNANHIPFNWTIFTNDKTPIADTNIVYKPPSLDILNYIADADYLVQLSDSEAYCYSVVEALSVGTPVIVTDCPVFKEIGVENGKNGFIVPFDMTDIPIEDIYKGVPEFTYRAPKDTWRDILAPGRSQYQEDLRTMVDVIATKYYFDIVLNKQIEIGTILTVSKVRARQLEQAKVAELVEKNNDI